tara:strand:+ start:14699 stop:15310 length:612 start_codon:yes stop_codon:yes gene_type:complete
MFFEPKNGHGLPHDPFRAIVAPRPIGWVSTVSQDGLINLAPYSFFNAVAGRPPMVILSSEGLKDSILNIEATREFVINLATLPMAERMNETSRGLPFDTNEFEFAGLESAASSLVKPPRVADCPAALECKVTDIIDLKNLAGEIGERRMAIGEVVGIYIDEQYLTDGKFDMVKAQTLARCGYWDYQVTTELFDMPRPDYRNEH